MTKGKVKGGGNGGEPDGIWGWRRVPGDAATLTALAVPTSLSSNSISVFSSTHPGLKAFTVSRDGCSNAMIAIWGDDGRRNWTRDNGDKSGDLSWSVWKW